MLNKIFILALAALPSLALADWSYVDKIDEFTDERVRYAVYSDDAHILQLSRENEAVWLFITRKGIGTFEPKGLIEMRVDKNEMRLTDPVKQEKLSKLLGYPIFQWEPSTVGFLLWHGKEQEGEECGYISELITGDVLKVRYQLNSLEKAAFKVTLQGASEAISKGLGLKICSKVEN